ncbi:MAG: hypothetical protein KDD37_08160, partial [Bdellovibrionales bacterium]|nr:hypothetical protein [Bdellovibrionales bacterium]
YTDAASTIVSKVSSVDTFSPTFTKSLFSVQSDEISMDVNVDGKVSVLFKSGEKLDLKQTYILAMPGGTHEMAGIIQSVQGVK